MAIQIPNIAKIAKKDPDLSEALLKVQTYVNNNVTPVQGNRLPKPPINATNNTA